METNLPLRRLFKLALITIPLFAITGAAPAFIFPNFAAVRALGSFIIVMLITTIIWLVNASLIYASSYYTLLQKTWFRFALSTLLQGILAMLIFNYTKQLRPLPNVMQRNEAPPMTSLVIILPIIQTLAINVIVFILIELLLLRELKNKILLENEQLKTANLEARVNSLKEQLHPHFLFNSLSTLKSLINRSPENANTYLESLSDLLRFSTSNQNAVIPLQDEVTLCINYLNMQKVRFGQALHFTINVPDNQIFNIKVPVYSLQQLAENAIKHNILTAAQPLYIDILYHTEHKEITVRNNIQLKPELETHLGTGLTNLNERYKLLGYKNIEIRNTENFFSVTIQLIINENNNY
jgi:two-component system, LytTR family, sensor kinase